MLDTLWRTTALITMLGLVGLLAARYGQRAGGANPDGAATASATPGVDGGTAASATPDADGNARTREAPNQIIIDNFTFKPATLTVSAGTKVTWINRDDVPHTATSPGKPKSFASAALDTDEQFSHVFTVPGTYPYYCAVHPHMTGRIIVK